MMYRAMVIDGVGRTTIAARKSATSEPILLPYVPARTARPKEITVTQILRGKYVGECIGCEPAESHNYVACPICGGWIDCRDQSALAAHTEPLPHPAQDQPQ
jgi:hypothetical protein